MSTEYIKALTFQLSHGLEFEKKYITSTIKKMFKVELDMLRRDFEQNKNYLQEFETRFNMTSDEFFESFNAGKLGDDKEYIKWYAYKDTNDKLMERIRVIEKIIHA